MFRLWDTERRTWWRDKGGSIDGSPLDLPPKHSISSVAPPPEGLAPQGNREVHGGKPTIPKAEWAEIVTSLSPTGILARTI